ncbi:hypothetical protein [Luteipulveratus mongoliensis]|uniref:N-acetylmuramoyl-L-alanine amidase domain-containing protein n=1 Tax=Luteipulveratus mongoliensis TaxID=571913 RepID=A0A0K1JGA2_9MICO|nr:hypothetical protein [Luteipulveratus mongoliensis]AKU15737.1 hypothetical protein VV02_07550 [Luteipulveratus mongoliensis]
MPTWLPEFSRDAHPYGSLAFYPALSGGQPAAMDATPCGLAHSTESPNLPGYEGGATNPNFTIDPYRMARRQHVPANVGSRALRGSVAIACAAVQVEIVGYCDKATATKRGHMAYYLPDLGEAGLKYLAESLAIIGKACGIPATSSVKWKAYPASAGVDNGIRLSLAAFKSYAGWLGHQHAPDPNFHGDPGALNMTRVLQLMQPKPATQTLEMSWAAHARLRYVLGQTTFPTVGVLKVDTVTPWQQRMGTTDDGVVSNPSSLVAAVQAYLSDDSIGYSLKASGAWDTATRAACEDYLLNKNGAFTR